MKDELKLHLDNVVELVTQGKKRIAIHGIPGEGKTTLINKLAAVLPADWNIYPEEMAPVQAPYIRASVGTEWHEDWGPAPDVYYVIQYSEDYKRQVTGITFADDLPRPFREYIKVRDIQRMQEKGLSGQTFKSLDEIKAALR